MDVMKVAAYEPKQVKRKKDGGHPAGNLIREWHHFCRKVKAARCNKGGRRFLGLSRSPTGVSFEVLEGRRPPEERPG